ncbi:MAG: sulfur carrier protein ThiS [Acidobacteria bacterium]|nr:sulfur carrier protein ThiS [Acidobacteriota bacterium]
MRSNVLSRKKVTKQLISVEINGERREIPASLNVRGLLEHLQIDTARVAVELNKEIVRKAAWDATPVEAGAQIEIVMFVGGGKN